MNRMVADLNLRVKQNQIDLTKLYEQNMALNLSKSGYQQKIKTLASDKEKLEHELSCLKNIVMQQNDDKKLLEQNYQEMSEAFEGYSSIHR